MTGLELARLWMLLRPVQRIRQWRTKRKMQSWAEHHLDEVPEDFHNTDEDNGMDALKGALKSKTMWFGLLLSVAGAVGLYLQTDVMPLVHSDPAALLVIGLAIKVLRVLTSQPLSAK